MVILAAISGWVLIGVMAAVVVLGLMMALINRYRKCPSDRIMVIYGKTAGHQAAKCIHGGAKLVWPVIQDYGYMSLRPMQIEVNLDNALCKQNIRINVPSVFTVGISTREDIMGNAADRLFGQDQDSISELAKDIIFGQLRLVIASMTIEEINADRETFLRQVETNVAEELNKVGLELLNVNITDITDESGYIEAIGRKAAAEAINKAKVDVAEETRKGSIGEAEAQKQQRIAVSVANAAAVSGEADAMRQQRIAVKQAEAKAAAGEAEAQKQQRIAVSMADAQAVSGEADAQKQQRIAVKQADATATEGENLAKIDIAKSNATRAEQEAEAFRRAEAAKRVAEAKVQQAQFDAEREAQVVRAGMEKEKQRAEIIVPAEIRKQQVEIAAEAEAEKRRREAKGEADAIFAKLDAEARGNFQILKAKGEGFEEIFKACDHDSSAAARMLLIEKLQDIVALQTEAIKNIKIDKVTVWDNGGKGADGKTSTAGFLSGMMQSLPPLHDVANMAGIDLPGYLGSIKEEKPAASQPQAKAETKKQA
ncbi:MAG: SPFH domain-containing protein [Victivallales bacterium]|nr:SPFH domain-containing protein [Victivallales bacterium]